MILPFNRTRGPAVAPASYRVIHNAQAESADIYLYGVIGGGGWFDDTGITADQFQKDLKALGAVKTLDVRINSEGGDVFDAQAIYNLLVQHKASVTVHIDGLAASAASFIAMAGEKILVAENAFMMIHNASMVAFGQAVDLEKAATMLRSVDAVITDVYAARTRTPLATIRTMMSDETWMSGKEAIKLNFADELLPNLQIAACVSQPDRFRKVPEALRPRRAAAMAAIHSMTPNRKGR